MLLPCLEANTSEKRIKRIIAKPVRSMTPCSLTDTYKCFGVTCFLHIQGNSLYPAEGGNALQQ
jgi:hypothetical protein